MDPHVVMMCVELGNAVGRDPALWRRNVAAVPQVPGQHVAGRNSVAAESTALPGAARRGQNDVVNTMGR